MRCVPCVCALLGVLFDPACCSLTHCFSPFRPFFGLDMESVVDQVSRTLHHLYEQVRIAW